MRKTILFVIGSALLMAGIGLTLSACSSDEELTARDVPTVLRGRWQFINPESNEVLNDNSYIEFTSDNKAVYSVSIQDVEEDSVRRTSSEYHLEDDWAYSSNDNILEGHILFRMGFKDPADSNSLDRFHCTLTGSRMVLLPDMDNLYFVKDPTMYLMKVR